MFSNRLWTAFLGSRQTEKERENPRSFSVLEPTLNSLSGRQANAKGTEMERKKARSCYVLELTLNIFSRQRANRKGTRKTPFNLWSWTYFKQQANAKGTERPVPSIYSSIYKCYPVIIPYPPLSVTVSGESVSTLLANAFDARRRRHWATVQKRYGTPRVESVMHRIT